MIFEYFSPKGKVPYLILPPFSSHQFIYKLIQTMSYRTKNNPEQLKAINLSFKMLTAINSSPNLPFKSAITSLEQLRNRLNAANQAFEHRKPAHQAMRNWCENRELDFTSALEIAQTVNKKKREVSEKEVAANRKEVEFDIIDSLDYLQKGEENVAYFASWLALQTNQTNPHLKTLINTLIQTKQRVTENISIINQSLENVPTLSTAEFFEKCESIIEYCCPVNQHQRQSLKLTLGEDFLWLGFFEKETNSLQNLAKRKRKDIVMPVLCQLDERLNAKWSEQSELRALVKDQISGFISQFQELKEIKKRGGKLKNEYLGNKASLEQTLTVLISIGRLEEILSLYDKVPHEQLVIIQLLILLAFDYPLLQAIIVDGKSSTKAKSKLIQIILKIAAFASTFRQVNTNYYLTLLKVIIKIMEKLEQYHAEFIELPAEVASNIELCLSDFEQLNHRQLFNEPIKNTLGAKLIEIIVQRIKIATNSEYQKLAQLCSDLKVGDFFVKFILKSELESLEEGKSSEWSSFEPSEENDQPTLSTVLKIKNHMQNSFTLENNIILDFHASLLELKELVRFRSKNQLSARQKEFQGYLEDYRLLNALEKLCEHELHEHVNLFDIYVRYYEQMCKMYRILILPKGSMGQLKRQYGQLSNQLASLQNRYPTMKSNRLEMLINQLQH